MIRRKGSLYKQILLHVIMSVASGNYSNPFASDGVMPTDVDQDLYQAKPFESKAKLKKRSGSKKPRSKRK